MVNWKNGLMMFRACLILPVCLLLWGCPGGTPVPVGGGLVNLNKNESTVPSWSPQYIVKNAYWGDPNVSKDESVSMHVDATAKTISWEWDFPTASASQKTPWAFPEVQFGLKPFLGEEQTGTSLLSAATFSQDFRVTGRFVQSTDLFGRSDTALDWFFSDRGMPKGELMVWLRSSRETATTEPVVVNGKNFELRSWTAKDTRGSWKALAFVDKNPPADGEQFTVDSLLAFLDAAILARVPEAVEWRTLQLSSVEFGTEIISGAAQVTLNDYLVKSLPAKIAEVSLSGYGGKTLYIARVSGSSRYTFQTTDIAALPISQHWSVTLPPGTYHVALFDPNATSNAWTTTGLVSTFAAFGAYETTFSGTDLNLTKSPPVTSTLPATPVVQIVVPAP